MKKLRVMLVEDEYLVLMGLRAIVEDMGHEVVAEALNGIQAFEKVAAADPDIVLMDINMPHMNGLAAIERMKSILEVPIVIISGYSDSELIREANELGVHGYLVKPVSRQDVEPVITLAISRFEEMQMLKREVSNKNLEIERRKQMEKAKGVVMKRLGLDEAAALSWMQKKCRSTNVSMAELAAIILKAYD